MISVILPVLDEARALPATLASLRARPGDFELIVADGGSTDGSVEWLLAQPDVRLVRSARGRAMQMNAGAAQARGDLLLFLHADTRLPAGALAALAAGHRRGDFRAGAFRHRFAGTGWRLALVSWGNNLRCRLSRIYFGDQGLFVERALFERLGGFPEVAALEDVIFCERLRRHTRAVLLPMAATTDARRFLHHGVWRSTWRALVILVRHRLGLPALHRGYADPVR